MAVNEPNAASPDNVQSEADHIGQLPGLLTAEKVTELVVVRCVGALYGIEVKWVREIRPFTEATPVYGLPEFWVGIAALRGQLFAMLDLQQLLDHQAVAAANRRQVLFTAVNDTFIGLLVEAVVAVRQVDAQAITAVATPEMPYLLGTIANQITVIDLPTLFADPRLTPPAGQVNRAEA